MSRAPKGVPAALAPWVKAGLDVRAAEAFSDAGIDPEAVEHYRVNGITDPETVTAIRGGATVAEPTNVGSSGKPLDSVLLSETDRVAAERPYRRALARATSRPISPPPVVESEDFFSGVLFENEDPVEPVKIGDVVALGPTALGEVHEIAHAEPDLAYPYGSVRIVVGLNGRRITEARLPYGRCLPTLTPEEVDQWVRTS